ncbi:hypothetical protein BGAFAR04_F0025 (plasmid) [Borreliella garinii Far04]|nr:hypothetical protein BGAFAR04_F0025 [Borreliella garinii Far04]
MNSFLKNLQPRPEAFYKLNTNITRELLMDNNSIVNSQLTINSKKNQSLFAKFLIKISKNTSFN